MGTVLVGFHIEPNDLQVEIGQVRFFSAAHGSTASPQGSYGQAAAILAFSLLRVMQRHVPLPAVFTRRAELAHSVPMEGYF